MGDWDKISDYLVTKCDERGGYYRLTIKETNRLAKRSKKVQEDCKLTGKRIQEILIPLYMIRHPDYEFGVSVDKKYLWCRRRGVLG
ncbi:MAG: hypothetical protein ACFFBS_08330 [Promethearchaeota archaeon]